MIPSRDCSYCSDIMVLAGGGWVCINPECENAGHLQAQYGEDE